MSAAETVRTLLAADGTLAALATGGFYDGSLVSRSGINRTGFPNAYDTSTHLMKPLVVVRNLTDIVHPAARDPQEKYRAIDGYLEVRTYNDGNAGYSVVNQMADRIITRLDFERIANAGYLQLEDRENDQRDPFSNNAAFCRLMFSCLYSING